MTTGLLAKHGYTVDYGFFNGVCRGADRAPLEVEKTLTETTIKWLLETVAPDMEKRVADLSSGAVLPRWFKRVVNGGRSEKVPVEREALTDYEAKTQVSNAIFAARQEANNARFHAKMLAERIVARHGQPLYPVNREDRKEIKVGVSVRIGGKKGWVGEVVEVKDAIARGCGPYMNGHSMPHAFIRSPKNNIIQVPCRTIRQDAIIGA
jgi:hypothetical protein